MQKAKEVRPLVEKCITIARRALPAGEAAAEFATEAERNSDEWRAWRTSDRWQQWNQAIAPVVAARRRALRLLGDKQAVRILFEDIAPRFADRPGGYTRVLRLAKPRLGDAGTRAILEFVGVRDRITQRARRRDSKPRPREMMNDECGTMRLVRVLIHSSFMAYRSAFLPCRPATRRMVSISRGT